MAAAADLAGMRAALWPMSVRPQETILPAMAGAAVGPGGHVDLCSRALPADVAHIRGAGLEGVPLVQGQQKAVHGVASLGPPGLGIRCVVQIILAAHARARSLPE